MNGLTLHFLVALKSGLRSHGMRLILILGVFLMFVAFLAAAFSLRQPLIIAMDVGLSGIRITALLLALFWVQEVFSKDVENKTVLFMLAYPLPRWHYVLGRYAGILALSALAVLVQGLLLQGVVMLSAWGYADSSVPHGWLPYALTLGGIFLDIAVVTAFAVLLAVVAETPFLPVVIASAFAIAARGLGSVLDYLRYSPRASSEEVTGYLPWLEMLQWVMPSLDRLDWRNTVLYGVWPVPAEFGWSILMAAFYLLLCLGLAMMLFERRQFQ